MSGYTSEGYKLAKLSVEVTDWQGAKAQDYQDVPSFRNIAGQDASPLKMQSYFCASHKVKEKILL